MHPVERVQKSRAMRSEEGSTLQDVETFLRVYFNSFTAGAFLIGLPIVGFGLVAVLFVFGSASVLALILIGGTIALWIKTVLFGLPLGFGIWMLVRFSLRRFGVAEKKSLLFVSVPTVMAALHSGLSMSDAKSFDVEALSIASSRMFFEFWLLYPFGVVLPLFFAMREINE